MDTALWAGKILAALLAFAAGFGLGGSTPGWEMDRFNEGTPRGDRDYRWLSYSSGGSLFGCLAGMHKQWFFCSLGSLLLWLICWPKDIGAKFLGVDSGVWALFGLCAVGYIIGVACSRRPGEES
jgi:hypothetical protein